MAGRGIEKLSDLAVKNAASKDKPFKLSDGAGLYLEVMPNGAKYWRLKYRFGGKEKRLALGVYPAVALKAARKAGRAARDVLAEGTDPGEVRRQEKLARSVGSANSFEAVALEWYEKEKPHWSESHVKRAGWLLEKNLFPWLGHRPIAEINPPELLAVLRKTEGKGDQFKFLIPRTFPPSPLNPPNGGFFVCAAYSIAISQRAGVLSNDVDAT